MPEIGKGHHLFQNQQELQDHLRQYKSASDLPDNFSFTVLSTSGSKHEFSFPAGPITVHVRFDTVAKYLEAWASKWGVEGGKIHIGADGGSQRIGFSALGFKLFGELGVQWDPLKIWASLTYKVPFGSEHSINWSYPS
ncbi:hypothetical protein IL38_23700 [Actinopolyspora erythraea]|uniref:Uncharacterized protein n=1 Tax=Actinopolyspora erythraea TaxID=414996 RepID=A0ABR4WYL9_9ACTN|nr:hypothetical protein [Actinopolyspora erythraea]KGI79318.1 hypothetical protein IL38_23700 [Actinopolyspora erythraea]